MRRLKYMGMVLDLFDSKKLTAKDLEELYLRADTNEGGGIPVVYTFKNKGDDVSGGEKYTAYPEYANTPSQFSYPAFNYGPFSSQYEQLRSAALDKVNNFSYNPEEDTSYKAYARQYTRNGEDAYRNAMARLASRTGGVASSYAVQASQGTYNNYMQELAAKVPELAELAHQKAEDEYNRYNDLYKQDYSIYSDDYNRAKAAYDDQLNIALKNWQAQESAREAAAKLNYSQKLSAYENALAASGNGTEDYSDLIKEMKDMNDAERAISYIDNVMPGLSDEEKKILWSKAGYSADDIVDDEYVRNHTGRDVNAGSGTHIPTESIYQQYQNGKITKGTYNALLEANEKAARNAEIREAYNNGKITFKEMLQLLQ